MAHYRGRDEERILPSARVDAISALILDAPVLFIREGVGAALQLVADARIRFEGV
jgi:hypothetical protein